MPIVVTRRDGSKFLSHRFTKSQLNGHDAYTSRQKYDIVHSDNVEFPFDPLREYRVRSFNLKGFVFEELWTQEVL